MRKRERIRWLTGILLVGILGVLFVPECDEYYFSYWSYNSAADYLLTRPNPEPGVLVGVPENGRYLGNLLGVTLGKLAFSPLWMLHGLVMAGFLLLLIRVLRLHLQDRTVSRREAGSVAFAAVILAPRGIWQEVYSWGAAFVNYLIPMVGILYLVRWLDPEQKEKPPLSVGLLSCACGLFLEPITLMMAAGAAAAVLAVHRGRLSRRSGLAAAAGACLGALLMASAPGYFHSTNAARRVSLSLLTRNLPVILTQTFQRPALLAAAISFLFVWQLRRQKNRCWPLLAAAAGGIHGLFLGAALLDLRHPVNSASLLGAALSAVLAVLWCVMLWQWKDRRKGRCMLAAAALMLLNGPLLVVSPIGPRNFFPAYLCLVMVALALYQAAREQGMGSAAWLRFGAAAALSVLIVIYGCNFAVSHQRLESGRAQVAAGSREVTLPLLPFAGWTVNEAPGKGDLSFVLYREKPWDVKLTFVPYVDFSERS